MSFLGTGLRPLINTVRSPWSGSVLRRPDESMGGAVHAHIVPGDEAVAVGGGNLRSQGARRVNGSEDAPKEEKAVRVALSVVVPSRHLTAVVDGERKGVEGAGRFDVAEDTINPHHGMSETARLIGGKPAHVSLLVDPVKPCSERAGKADFVKDAVLPDEAIRRSGSFRRNAPYSQG